MTIRPEVTFRMACVSLTTTTKTKTQEPKVRKEQRTRHTKTVLWEA